MQKKEGKCEDFVESLVQVLNYVNFIENFVIMKHISNLSIEIPIFYVKFIPYD